MAFEHPHPQCVLRTVTMTVHDWPRFEAAFEWLMGYSSQLAGCRSIVCYRAVEEPTQVCIVEYWDSLDAVGPAYEQLGDLPKEFMVRAGQPEFGVSTYWSPPAAPVPGFS